MQMYIICFIILLKFDFISSFSRTNIFPTAAFLTQEEIIPRKGMSDVFKSYFIKLINATIKEDNARVSPQCKEILSSAYITGKKTDIFFTKLLRDSSKNKNDVGSFNECQLNKYETNIDEKEILKEFTYLVVSVDLTAEKHQEINTTLYETYWYMVGLCVVSGCSDEEYNEILYSINMNLENILWLESRESLFVFSMENNKFKQFHAKYIFFMLPLVILLVQILLVVFTQIPPLLFKRCFKHRHAKKTEFDVRKQCENSTKELMISSDIGEISKKDLFKFTSSFDLSENGEELFFTTSPITDHTNESGLAYIRGLRGLSMFFLIFGFTYYNLHNSFIKIYGESTYISLISNFLFGFIFFGLRFSPRILFSCSGFSLTYKYLCYLDDALDSEYEKLVVKEEKKNDKDKVVAFRSMQLNTINTFQMNYNDNTLLNNSSSLTDRDPNEMPYSSLSKFFIYHIHKYLLLIYIASFFKYTLYYLVFGVREIGPLWMFFKMKIMDEKRFLDFLGHFLLFGSYEIWESQNNCLMNIFWMGLNECHFFIISTILIFFSYKKRLRMDMIILCLILVLIIARFAYVNLHGSLYPTLYSYGYDYGTLFINSIYNYPYFLFGMLFGLLNYALQKEITWWQAAIEKPYLISAVKLLYAFKGKSKCCMYILGSTALGLIIFLSIVQPLVLAIFPTSDTHLNYFFVNPFINNFFLIDIDLVVCLVHFIAFGFYIKGENLVNRFLSHNSWNVLNKLYFSFILLINPVIFYIFYQSETRIKLDKFYIFFYSIISGFIILFISAFFFVFFEMPCKRIAKHLVNREKNKNKENSEKIINV